MSDVLRVARFYWVSYLLGLDTYFNHPTALQATAPLTLGEALRVRAPALAIGSALQGIVGIIGWLLGGPLPRDPSAR